MSNVLPGWRLYHQGRYEDALHLFAAHQNLEATAGTALSLLAQGRGTEALAQLERASRNQRNPLFSALRADLIGRNGDRQEAEQLLDQALRQHPSNGFFFALRGEQRIRQGNWDAGTQDFINAMEHRNDLTFPQFQRVIADMVDAVAARRIPASNAMRFINRVDYSSAQKPQPMNFFFAEARRALTATRRIERDGIVEPWSLLNQGVPTATAPSNPPVPSPPSTPVPPHSPGSRPTEPPSARSPAQERRQRQEERRQRSQQSQEQRRSQEQRNQTIQQTLAQRPAQRSPGTTGLEAKLPNMTAGPIVDVDAGDAFLAAVDELAVRTALKAVLREEFARNESLQDLVAAIPAQVWPSELEISIDNVDPIGFSSEPILRGSSKISNSNFRITGGDIRVQITLERCMQNLLAATHSLKPVNLPLVPLSIYRLELNLQDDFHKSMPTLEALYHEETQVQNEHQLAIGKFIGACIVQSYGGIWRYENPPEESAVFLGAHRLDPMALARDFLSTTSFDEVDFSTIIHEAEQAVRTSISLPTFREHIDPTPGLEKEALAMSLAELWIDYRFNLSETDIQAIAPSISVLGIRPRMILFSIDANYVPSNIIKSIGGSHTHSGKTVMAYGRRTGDFLILPSAKHFSRMLELIGLPLTRPHLDTMAMLASFFRPGWTVVHSDEIRHEVSAGAQVKLPAFRERNRETALRLSALDQNGRSRTIVINYRPDRLMPYEISLD